MLCKTATKFFNRTESPCLEDVCARVVSACHSRFLKDGVCVHSPIIKLGLKDHVELNNNLLLVYAKCVGQETARHFFDEMPCRDVMSWTGMLSTYVRNGSHEDALDLFDLMLASGQCPNEFTISSALRSCSVFGEFDYGTRVQGFMVKLGFESNPVLGSNLIRLYSKHDRSEEAYKLIRNMDNVDVVSWTTMIASFVQAHQWGQALHLFINMIKAKVPPNEFTFAEVLVASGFLGLNYGRLVHAHVMKWGVELNVVLKTALVNMYARWQRMDEAIKVAALTPEFDVLLWTSMISALSKNLKYREAVAGFQEMRVSGIEPNSFTYSSIINACCWIPSLELGKQTHLLAIVSGLEDALDVGNALVDMYMKCSLVIDDALKVFRGMRLPNVISWTTLIAGLAEHGFEQDCFRAFMEMRAEGVQPNSFTLSSILGTCSTVRFPCLTLQLHGYIIKTKTDRHTAVGNALVDAYAGLGMLNDAWSVVSMMDHKNAITYTSVATRLNQMGHHEKALNIISYMQNNGIKMDGYSLSSFLSASATLAIMETGKQLHCHSVKSGLDSWISVSNSIVDLYGKCGFVDDVHRSFEDIGEPDVVSWNGLIHGLASNGHISSALSAFDDMRLAGVKPDSVTLLLVLFTCSHGGLVDMGLDHFQSMREMHDIEPQMDHYVCLVDLLGRDGRLEEALKVVETMPFRPDALIHKTLLGACKVHLNVPLGEDMARRGLELDPSDPAFYVLLASLYDDARRPDLGEKTRRMMRERGLRKSPGHSWMEIRNKIHLFITGDRSHPDIDEISEKIKSLITEFKNQGYTYLDNGGSVYHSEKLAVAFGLLNTPSMAPIRIIKNTRICSDCHDFILLVTQLVSREIIVKDGNRFHSFTRGECTCRGYQ